MLKMLNKNMNKKILKTNKYPAQKNRLITKDEFGSKEISYEGVDIFEEFNLRIDNFYHRLTLGCKFIEYDIEDYPVNRRIKLTRKDAFRLMLDLIKYILTGKI